ncbi:MAG: sugar phosphate isomerase/epimerase [Microbacterium sp.]
MKLGFLTACMADRSLQEVLSWAGSHDFEALEVGCWEENDPSTYHARHIDVRSLDAGEAARVNDAFAAAGVSISALAYYENNLHGDPRARDRINEHLRACIRAASLLNVDTVGTFIGRDLTASVADNLREGAKVLPDLVGYAADHGVTLVIENCPMEGWGPDGYPANLAYTPELWDWIIEMGFSLNFDPSHLMWLGIDPVAALKDYVPHVRHVQAKDVQIDPAARQRYSVFGRTVSRRDGWDTGWWRYRIPGLGQVDWRGVIDALYEGGFDGTVSVEHEDPVWGGTPDRIETGLLIARRTLDALRAPQP